MTDFDSMYESTPPWDIDRPQPAYLGVRDAGLLSGRVLDAGCGTGEHALMAAAAGFEATGVDFAPRAIAKAQAKAAERGLSARFLVADALHLDSLGETFDTVLDCGLFHTFDDADRAKLVISLGSAVAPGGQYFLLCFSEHQPGEYGPRRITQDEIRASFADGWEIESIEPARIDVTFDPNGMAGWLARIRRGR